MNHSAKYSVKKIWRRTKRKWLPIYLGVLLGVLGMSVYSFLLAPEVYQSHTQIAIKRGNADQTGQAGGLDLIKTYGDLVHTPLVLDEIAKTYQLSGEELSKKIQLETDEQSTVVQLHVSDSNPQRAADLAQKVSDRFIAEVPKVIPVDQVTLLTPAKVNKRPVSPIHWINLLLGACVGGLVALIIQIVRIVKDDSIRHQEVVKWMGWSLMGVIPQMSSESINISRFNRQFPGKEDNRSLKKRV